MGPAKSDMELTENVARSNNTPITQRATVNILNVPFGQDPEDYIGIIKHFELPVSMSSFERGGTELYNNSQTPDTNQYGRNLSGRPAITA